MKRAILSDVHGNLEALGAVLAEIRGLGVDEIWSLGDAVGYGPEPDACVDLLREEAAVNLMGNHDAAVAEMTPLEDFNINARRAVEWTRSAVSARTMEFIEALPYTERREDTLLVHASPRRPKAWNYIMSLREAEEGFGFFEEQACFIGHTHVPFIVTRRGDGDAELLHEQSAQVRDGVRCIVNVGSVGQPRDHDPRASFAVLDDGTGEVEIRRVPYAVEKTQVRMRALGLPLYLSERLSAGR
jgi:diadenosine tetraphosphatase ApaH/serine/threonine PP2A family protein phosphatase